jgi:DNA-binding transcriptional LysR family regulator
MMVKNNIHYIVDHISEGVDLAFRVGELKDSSLVAKQVLLYRRQLVASPEYLRKYSTPEHPNDLLNHRLIAFSFFPTDATWTFYRSDHKKESVVFQPTLSMNDYAGVATALASGNGIGDLPPIVAPDLLRNGELVEVMTDWRLKPEKLSLVHTSNRHMARPVRLFKDFVAQLAPTLFPELPV